MNTYTEFIFFNYILHEKLMGVELTSVVKYV